jgi:uncharacterized protein YndB with AHSA1/START domain
MKKLQYSIHIKAPKEKVWHTMLDDPTYRQWADAFSPGSHYIGSWEKGSKILFLGPDEEGKTRGMVSTIAENIPYDFISIKHLGEVIQGVEKIENSDSGVWANAYENYTLLEKDGFTDLQIELDAANAPDEMFDMFNDMWPKALEKLKRLAEK